MNKVDRDYLDLLRDIMENGVEKDTRSGKVKSVFGRQMRFDLKESFPLLTTKKMFTKGVIYELLWFLQKPCNWHESMNIEWLLRNNVHIWDDDAYRWFKNDIVERFSGKIKEIVVPVVDDYRSSYKPGFEHWIEESLRKDDEEWLKNITKDEFIDLTLQKVELRGPYMSIYRFGDLGPIYGKQWRMFGSKWMDQISNIIRTLKTNPNDRRMLCVAYNPDEVHEMALPPCHVMMQFYTRKLEDGSTGLSCMWTQRSVDSCLGLPFNISSYALLTHMIAHVVGMVPDELICSLGDAHIYEAHLDAVNEQLSREGSDELPQLKISREVEDIDDFKFEDFEIVNYHPNPPIKAPLLVG